MSGLLNALGLAAVLSLPAALLAWSIARAFGAQASRPWRMARLAALLPLCLAPVIFLVPDMVQPVTMGGPAHLPLEETVIPTLTAAPVAEAPGLQFPAIGDTLLGAYFAGLLLALVAAARRHFWRRRMLKTSRRAEHGERRLLDALAEEMDVAAPDMRVIAGSGTPFLSGWRGVIIVPESLLYAPAKARHALVHELTHLSRGDERDRLTGSALLVLLWFNWPLRWIEQELDAAREIECDAESLEVLGGTERKPYAQTLIDMMRGTAQPVSAFGPRYRRHREMRIKAILSAPASGLRNRLMTVAVMASIIPVGCAQAALTERSDLLAASDEPPSLLHVAEGEALHTDGEIHADLRPDASFAPAAEPEVEPHPEPHPAPRADLRDEGANEMFFGDMTAGAPVSPEAHQGENNVMFGPEADAHHGSEQGDHDVRAPELTHSVTTGRISSRYGPRPSRPADSPKFHYGVDVAAPSGTAIFAPGDGVVTYAADGFNGSSAWGYTLVIDHGQGWQTVFAHMQGFDVEVGDAVDAGDQIGRVGATGRVTGPHVHVELRHNGERIDPAGYVPGLR